MSDCCDPRNPKVYRLNVGGELVGLIGLEQAFLDLRSLNLLDEDASEKLLEIVKQKNYIPERVVKEYKIALLVEYKNYIAKLRNNTG